MNEVRSGMRSMIGETLPGTRSKANSVASGKTSQSASTHFSPPRIPVNHSWTIAIRGDVGEARMRETYKEGWAEAR